MGKAILLEWGQWWDVLQYVEMVPPLEVGSPLELGPPLEVVAGVVFGQGKQVQGEVDMRPGRGFEATGSWTDSSWISCRGSWRWPRAVRGGRHWNHL